MNNMKLKGWLVPLCAGSGSALHVRCRAAQLLGKGKQASYHCTVTDPVKRIAGRTAWGLFAAAWRCPATRASTYLHAAGTAAPLLTFRRASPAAPPLRSATASPELRRPEMAAGPAHKITEALGATHHELAHTGHTQRSYDRRSAARISFLPKL